MLTVLYDRNSSIKELQNKLRQSPGRISISEVEEMLSSVSDRKAFILLLDMYETEKEITRELLEDLIEHSYEINNGILLYLNSNTINISKVFNLKYIKALIIISILLGITITITTNDRIAELVIRSALEKDR